MSASELSIVFKGDTSDAMGKIGGLKGALGGLGDFAGGVLKVGLLGAVGGAAALAGGLAASVKAAMDAQAGQAALNAVLESTKGKSGMTADAVNELASSLQNVTRFEDDAILAGQNMLLTFTNIGKDVFPQATETMLNMATAMGTDAKSQAVALGKALNDPIKGIAALSRVGVTFTDEQKELIKTLQESGDMAGAQKVILAELETEFGGAARAAGDTFAGKLDILQNKFGDVMETVGGALIPILSQIADKFLELMNNPFIQKAAEEIGDLFTSLEDPIGTVANIVFYLSQAFGANKEQATELFGAVVGLRGVFDTFLATVSNVAAVLGSALSEAWAFIQPILQAIFAELAKFGAEVLPKVQAAWENIQNVIMTIAAGIAAFIAEHATEIQAILEGAWLIIQGVVEVAWALIEGIIKIALDLIAGDFEAAGADFQTMMQSIWSGIQTIIEGAWMQIQAYIKLALDTIGKAIEEKLNQIKQWFSDRFNEIIAATQSQLAGLIKTFNDFINDAVALFTEKAAAVFTAAQNFMQGIYDGLNSYLGDVMGIIQSIIDAITSIPFLDGGGGGGSTNIPPPSPSPSSDTGGGGPSRSFTDNRAVTIYANVRSDADLERLADAISARLGTRAQHRIARGF